MKQKLYLRITKPLLDRAGALLGLILLAPVLGLTALAVWISMGRPILFRQQRPGYKGQPFTILKFRTMSEEADPKGSPAPDAARLTRVGRILRASSLDELPELVNILRGEMSLVGPRPLLMKYLELYTPEQMKRHEVKPGLTGWAQIHGRNATSWARRFELDLWYREHVSLWLDLKIMAITLWKMIKREGINEPGQATAREFTGNGS